MKPKSYLTACFLLVTVTFCARPSRADSAPDRVLGQGDLAMISNRSRVGFEVEPDRDLPGFSNFYRGERLRGSANAFGMCAVVEAHLADRGSTGKRLTDESEVELRARFELASEAEHYESVPRPKVGSACATILRGLQSAWIRWPNDGFPGRNTVTVYSRDGKKRRYLLVFDGRWESVVVDRSTTATEALVFSFYDPHTPKPRQIYRLLYRAGDDESFWMDDDWTGDHAGATDETIQVELANPKAGDPPLGTFSKLPVDQIGLAAPKEIFWRSLGWKAEPVMPSDPALKSTAAANALGMGKISPEIVRMRARGGRETAIEGEFDDLDPLGSTE